MRRCSCGDAACAAPGAHPARPDWAAQATGSATVAGGCGSSSRPPRSCCPPGGRSTRLDVPETAGFLALARMERMGLTLGPVTLTPDRRMEFFVLPGAAAKVPELVRRLGWSLASLDLTVRGEGDYVAGAAHPGRVAGGLCSGPAGRLRRTGGCRTRRS